MLEDPAEEEDVLPEPLDPDGGEDDLVAAEAD